MPRSKKSLLTKTNVDLGDVEIYSGFLVLSICNVIFPCNCDYDIPKVNCIYLEYSVKKNRIRCLNALEFCTQLILITIWCQSYFSWTLVAFMFRNRCLFWFFSRVETCFGDSAFTFITCFSDVQIKYKPWHYYIMNYH